MNVAAPLLDHLRPVDELILLPGNPRQGDVQAIARSLERFGQLKPIVVDHDNVILAGNHTYQAALVLGWTHVAAVTSDLEGAERAGFALADNRLSDLATYDSDALLEMLSQAAGEDVATADLLNSAALGDALAGTGYDALDVIDVLEAQRAPAYAEARAAELAEGRRVGKAQRRTLPIDIIFSSLSAGPELVMACNNGWRPGIMTSHHAGAKRVLHRFPRIGRIGFMDNDWHDYDHAVHLAALATYSPTYATTRDLVTKEQAAEAGVEWYSIEQTLEHGEEVAACGVDNVIFIPKYREALDAIPETIGGKTAVLGYSVPSSYGGTDIPIKEFGGRPIHLLGGSWLNQRAYLDLMGEDIVSLDNNNIMLMAKYGAFTLGDGTKGTITELLPGAISGLSFYPALAISLSSIATAVREEYGSPLSEPVTETEDAEWVER